jgi:hypothetical protein
MDGEEIATGLPGVSNDPAPAAPAPAPAPSGGLTNDPAIGAQKLAALLRPAAALPKGGEFQEQKSKPSRSHAQSNVTTNPAEGARRLAAMTGKTLAPSLPPRPAPKPVELSEQQLYDRMRAGEKETYARTLADQVKEEQADRNRAAAARTRVQQIAEETRAIEREVAQQQQTAPPQTVAEEVNAELAAKQQAAFETKRQAIMARPEFFDGSHSDHYKAVREMNTLLYEEEVRESRAKGETFRADELAETLEHKFGVERMPMPTGIERTEDYDFHAATFFDGMASHGIEPEIVRSIVKDFEHSTVNSMGAPLTDGELQTMYDRYAPKLGKAFSDRILNWYKTAIRGDRA